MNDEEKYKKFINNLLPQIQSAINFYKEIEADEKVNPKYHIKAKALRWDLEPFDLLTKRNK